MRIQKPTLLRCMPWAAAAAAVTTPSSLMGYKACQPAAWPLALLGSNARALLLSGGDSFSPTALQAYSQPPCAATEPTVM
jgi:hypothetical protein